MASVIIIGAGAAGLFCALEAGKRGHRVTLVEKNATPGRKIIISGGGRCNFTNREVGSHNFVSSNPHFCKSALAGYRPSDFVDLVKRHKIPFYEKKLGQLFCRGRSHDILDMLLRECSKNGVEIVTDCRIDQITKGSQEFEINSTRGKYSADKLVVASGGLSFPKLGATDIGYRIARQFGHKIVATRPSLVPLRFRDRNFSALSGLSLEASISTDRSAFRENILFTHKGLSGPSVLQISNYWEPAESVNIDLLPEVDFGKELREKGNTKQKLKNFVADYLPARFASAFLDSSLADVPVSSLSDQQIGQLGEYVNAWNVYFNETEGYHKAEVTLGGVDTQGISSKSMESAKMPGLYFIGEVLDVTGWLGGYNFQWAWSSAFACARGIGTT